MKDDMKLAFEEMQKQFDDGLPLICEDVLAIVHFMDPKQRVQIHAGLFRLYSVNPVLSKTAWKRMDKKDARSWVNSLQLFDDVIYIGI